MPRASRTASGAGNISGRAASARARAAAFAQRTRTPMIRMPSNQQPARPESRLPRSLTSMAPACHAGHINMGWLASTLRKPGMLATVMLLAACTSVPLPPWTPGASRVVPGKPVAPASQTSPASPAQPPEGTPSEVQTFPVLPGGVSGGPPAAPASRADEPASYGPAVEARFPAPAVTYSTPGLQAGSMCSRRPRFAPDNRVQGAHHTERLVSLHRSTLPALGRSRKPWCANSTASVAT